MNKSAPFRLTGALALYYAFVYAFPALDGTEQAMCLSLGLALIGLLAAVWLNRPFLRFPAAVLPALPLIFVRAPLSLAAMGIGLLCFAVVVLANRLDMEHWRYAQLFPVLAFGAVVLILVTLLLEQHRTICILFAGLFLFFGVISLRMLRMGDAVDLRWAGKDLTAFTLPLCAAAGIGALTLPFLRLIRPLLHLIAVSLGYLLAFVTNLITAGMKTVGEWSGIQDDFYEETAYVYPIGETGAHEASTPEAASRPIDLPWKELLIGLGILLLLGLLIFFLYRLLTREKAAAEGRQDYETGVREKRRPGRRRKERVYSNAQKIRQLYREYLSLVQMKGLTVFRGTTSGEILDNTPIHAEDERTLRGIYLRARYGKGDAVSDRDVQAAADCLERIKKGS